MGLVRADAVDFAMFADDRLFLSLFFLFIASCRRSPS